MRRHSEKAMSATRKKVLICTYSARLEMITNYQDFMVLIEDLDRMGLCLVGCKTHLPIIQIAPDENDIQKITYRYDNNGSRKKSTKFQNLRKTLMVIEK